MGEIRFTKSQYVTSTHFNFFIMWCTRLEIAPEDHPLSISWETQPNVNASLYKKFIATLHVAISQTRMSW